MKRNYIEKILSVTPAYIRMEIIGGITFYYDNKPQFFTFKATIAEEIGIYKNKIYTYTDSKTAKTDIDISERPELPARFGDYKKKILEIIRVLLSGTEVEPITKQPNGTFVIESYKLKNKFEKYDDKQVTLNIIGSSLLELSVLHDTKNSSIPLFAPVCTERNENVYISEDEYQLNMY